MTGTHHRVRFQTDRILEVLAEHPGGLGVGAIADLLRARFDIALEPHAVAYRLRQLPPGTVRLSGKGKGRRYALEAPPTPGTESPVPLPPTTASAAEVRAMLQLPVDQRAWVGYDPNWLFDYTPNQTSYLPTELRTRLATIGRSPLAERPAGTFARDIYERLLIDLSWASSRLEGNTYSRLDTQLLLEFGQRAEGRDALEAQMILNHKAAIDLLVDSGPELIVSEHLLRGLHAALSENLMRNKAHEGQLRRGEVRIGNSKYFPTAVPQQIAECFARIATTAAAIADPFEQAFFLMVHLPYLQPFNDINKRTSRLAANIPLIARNLCPLTFVDVGEQEYIEAILAVYEFRRTELLRDVFSRAYEQSCALYLVAQEAVTAPDPLRLRYRDSLSDAIRTAVRDGIPPSRRWALEWAGEHDIAAQDRAAFTELLLSLLMALNDASSARHGLRPSEFTAWREKFRPT